MTVTNNQLWLDVRCAALRECSRACVCVFFSLSIVCRLVATFVLAQKLLAFRFLWSLGDCLPFIQGQLWN